MTTVRTTALLCALALLPFNTAFADIATPEGLAAGDLFRIVFVTSDIMAGTSNDITDYDQFVSDLALAPAAGLGTYAGAAVTWQAIASTPSVSASDPSRLPNSSVPWFLVNGDPVTSSDHDVWWPLNEVNFAVTPYPTALAAPINYTEKGDVLNDVTVWTGTLTDGTTAGEFSLGGPPSGGLLATHGNSSRTDVTWIYEAPGPTALLSQLGKYHFYGVSEVLTVVPEPGCLTLWTLALVAGSGYGIWRRRK